MDLRKKYKQDEKNYRIAVPKSPQHKPESHRTGSSFETAKANTPHSQRKQINVTLHGNCETLPATKKRRTPHPLREHVHRCLNRYFPHSTSKEHLQRKNSPAAKTRTTYRPQEQVDRFVD